MHPSANAFDPKGPGGLGNTGHLGGPVAGTSEAEQLVRHTLARIPAAEGRPAQELPNLRLVGAAIARAARLAAAEARARTPRLDLAATQAAGLLQTKARELDALVARNEAEEGRPIAPTTDRGFVWRLHPAPGATGPQVAPFPGEGMNGATA